MFRFAFQPEPDVILDRQRSEHPPQTKVRGASRKRPSFRSGLRRSPVSPRAWRYCSPATRQGSSLQTDPATGLGVLDASAINRFPRPIVPVLRAVGSFRYGLRLSKAAPDCRLLPSRIVIIAQLLRIPPARTIPKRVAYGPSVGRTWVRFVPEFSTRASLVSQRPPVATPVASFRWHISHPEPL